MDFGAWLAETYGQDLSGVTEIIKAKNRAMNVTGSLEPLAKCTALVILKLEGCVGLTGPCPRQARARGLEIANLKR